MIKRVVLIHKFVTVTNIKRNLPVKASVKVMDRTGVAAEARTEPMAKVSNDFWFLWPFLAGNGVSIVFILVVPSVAI